MKALVFWQNIPSILQAPLISAVADRWGGRVVVVTETDVAASRRALGWHRPEFGSSELIVEPSRVERQDLIRSLDMEESVHVFSGLRAYPETVRTMREVAKTRATMGIFSEPIREGLDSRRLARELLYRVSAVRWRKRLDFLLLTGERGVRQFRNFGFPGRRLFPFAYVVADSPPEKSALPNLPDSTATALRLVFVGQLIRRKGLDLLLRNLADLIEEDWTLDIIGVGTLEGHLQQEAKAIGLTERIVWHGALPNEEVRSWIRSADVLILPSRYDGWGAVVNEALTAGTRAIVSDACGSADLIQAPELGVVFEAESADSLADALRNQLRRGKVSCEQRRELQRWAKHAISPEVMAKYLVAVIESVSDSAPPPLRPWAYPLGSGGGPASAFPHEQDL